jgi:hypothetical protein
MRHPRINDNCPTCKPHRSGLALALTLVLVGLVFLLVNTGAIPTDYKSVLTAKPIWLLIVGLFLLFNRQWGVSTILLSLGIFFMIPYLGEVNPQWGIPENFTSIWWPVLLIIGGVLIFTCKYWFKNCIIGIGKADFTSSSKWENEDGYLTLNTSFDSQKNIVIDPIFKGGHVKCSFGEVILDLRKTELPEGNSKLIVDVSFGSVSVIVPSTWNIQIKGNSMFGTFSDERLNKTYYPEETRHLTIEGKVAFGECELRD